MTSSESRPLNDRILQDLRNRLEESVKRNLADGLLLSGGLDTTILAYLASRWRKPFCVTVAFAGAPAPDVEYAVQVAKNLGLEHDVCIFGEKELTDSLHRTVSVLKTFDPMEVRNSAAACIALKFARDKGFKTVMTGDAGDELFAGYSFFFEMTKQELDISLYKMWANMNFSSLALGDSLGLEVKIPFLDPDFVSYAKGLDSSLKVNRERGRTWGKWILRKAFEDMIPEELLWRVKAPLEVGTGTATLPSFFSSRIPDTIFQEKTRKYRSEDKVNIRDKEHLYYYEIYREEIGVPSPAGNFRKSCPACGSSLKEETNYCRTCGSYPIAPEEK